MENASKALIIAGSILIAILLIAFGVRIFTSASEPGDQLKVVTETTEMATFNSQFTQYAGLKKSASQVKALLNAIQVSNVRNTHKIDNPTLTIGDVDDSKQYNISISYADGYVKTITISENLE